MGKRRVLLGLFVLFAGLVPTRVMAETIVPTPTDIPENAPVMITSYQTRSQGAELEFLEIYNNDSAPIQLREWTITDTVNNRTLLFSPALRDGLLEPHAHTVIAADGAVAQASYRINGWSVTPPVVKTMTNFRLSHDGYRALDLALSAKNIDSWMMRSYLTASYSSSTFEANYRTLYDDGLYVAPTLPAGLKFVEIYPYASDCPPFDTSVLCGDYVKLANTSAGAIDLDGLVLRTDSGSTNRTTSNTITLGGTLAAGEYRAIALMDNDARLSLTNSGGYVWLEDTWSLAHYDETLTRYEPAGSSQQGYAYALDLSDGMWKWTTTPHPADANVITQPQVAVTVCPEGKYLNPDTGRCRTVADVINTLATCEEGSERNPLTNRCRKIATATTASALTPCKEGQERNPATNRCRSIASAVAELLPCDEGYERNPTTNRCRKIKATDMPTVGYPVQATPASSQTTALWWAVGGICALALGYAGWEWRQEIARGARRALSVFHR